MALVKCHECGKEVSTEAKKCPSCGANVRKPKKDLGILGSLFWLTVVGLSVFGLIRFSEQGVATNAPTRTSKQSAEVSKRDGKLQLAAAGALDLKRAMKDPEAFELTSLVVKPNGAACYKYRAKNSFGAIFPGEAVLSTAPKLLVHEKDGSEFVRVWNKECTAPGGDEIAYSLKVMDIL